jgi:hypothetical protein
VAPLKRTHLLHVDFDCKLLKKESKISYFKLYIKQLFPQKPSSQNIFFHHALQGVKNSTSTLPWQNAVEDTAKPL